MAEPIRILVIEDSVIAQVVIKKQLMNFGSGVDVASNGVEALEKTEKNTYDLILMDIGLGTGLNGFELSTMIKQQEGLNKNTPIIAVSAHGEMEFNHKALEVGMVGYYTKPFSPHDAANIINYLSDKAQKK